MVAVENCLRSARGVNRGVVCVKTVLWLLVLPVVLVAVVVSVGCVVAPWLMTVRQQIGAEGQVWKQLQQWEQLWMDDAGERWSDFE